MMDVREKLIGLIAKAKYICANDYSDHTEDEYIADTLLDNGVTVQSDMDINAKSNWIPVKDRLPDDSIPSTFYLCYWNGYIRVCKYWRARKVFELRGKTVKVTHWMPLPEPPKEDS